MIIKNIIIRDSELNIVINEKENIAEKIQCLSTRTNDFRWNDNEKIVKSKDVDCRSKKVETDEKFIDQIIDEKKSDGKNALTEETESDGKNAKLKTFAPSQRMSIHQR